MKTFTVLSYNQLVTLVRHGYISNIFTTKIIHITSDNIFNLILNSNPIRYEFDVVYVHIVDNSNDLNFENINAIYPLTANAKEKLEVDFPFLTFDSPLTKIDFNLIYKAFRNIEIQRMRYLLSDQIKPVSELLNTDFSDISLLRREAKINPKGINFLRTALLFNENDNYIDNDWKYIFRLGEIYFLSIKKLDGYNIRQTEIFNKYKNETDNTTLNDIITLCNHKEQKFIKTITGSKEKDSDLHHEIVPLYLKAKDQIDSSNFQDAYDLLSQIKNHTTYTYVANMLCSIYNFDQLLPFKNVIKVNTASTLVTIDSTKEIKSKPPQSTPNRKSNTKTIKKDNTIESKISIEWDIPKSNTSISPPSQNDKDTKQGKLFDTINEN